MRKIFFIFALFYFYPLSPTNAFSLSNFEVPESFVVDSEEGVYYVSNIAGSPTAKDGNGYISKISSNGNLVIQKFIGGKKNNPILHAPKGLLILGKELWVVDIDAVKIFDKFSGKFLNTIEFSRFSTKFLNDITSDPDGLVYVSDMLGNSIFKINPKQDYGITIFKTGEELGNPNGLQFNTKSKSLVVVTFFTGKILEIDRWGRIHVLKKGLAGLDGVDYDAEGNLYVSSLERGEIYRMTHYGRGTLTTYLSNLRTPADISVDKKKNELLIPSMKGNSVTTVFIAKASAQKSSR